MMGCVKEQKGASMKNRRINEATREDLIEVSNWIVAIAQEAGYAHEELKLLHYADILRDAAEKVETLKAAMAELEQCHENLRRASERIREFKVQLSRLETPNTRMEKGGRAQE